MQKWPIKSQKKTDTKCYVYAINTTIKYGCVVKD